MCHSSAPPPSSAQTTLRALVMLVCLVAIPAVALRGTSLGSILRRFLLEKLDKPEEPTAARADLDEAPRFVPPSASSSAPTTSLSIAGYESPEGSNAVWPGAAMADRGGAAPRVPLPPVISPPSGYEGSPEAANGRSLQSTEAGGAGKPWPRQENDHPATREPVVAAEYLDRFGAGPGIPPAIGTGSTGAASDPALPRESLSALSPERDNARTGRTVDQFLYIQQRLRELGATYYLLENWGDQGECYRFHCRVAVAGNANFTKHFECTDQDPLRAMTRVLSEVQTWRQSSLGWEPQTTAPTELGRLPDPRGGSGGAEMRRAWRPVPSGRRVLQSGPSERQWESPPRSPGTG